MDTRGVPTEIFEHVFEHSDVPMSLYHLPDLDDPDSLVRVVGNTASSKVAGIDLKPTEGLRFVDAFPSMAGTPGHDFLVRACRDQAHVEMGEQEMHDATSGVDGVFKATAIPAGDGYAVACAVNVTQQRRAEAMVNAQRDALQELATPVVQLWESVLLLPLVGVIDSRRSTQITERLLHEIVATESRVAILDVTGVPVIDTRVAQHLTSTIGAARMLGAEVILTGVRPEMAITLTKLGIDASRLNAKGRLRSGVRAALEAVGARVVED